MRAISSLYLRWSGLLLLSGLAAVYGQQNTITVSPSPIFVNVGPNDGPTTVPVAITTSNGPAVVTLGLPTVPWLTVSTVNTAVPANISLFVNPAGLNAGVYQTTLQLESGGPIPLLVVMTVSPGSSATANPGHLSFAYANGGGTPPTQSLAVNSPAAITYSVSASANWITVQTPSGQAGLGSAGTVSIGVDPASVNGPGTYVGSVTIVPSSGGSVLVPVVLQYGTTSQLYASTTPVVVNVPYSLQNTTGQTTVTINATGVPLKFQASTSLITDSFGQQWLSVTPQTGTTPATLTLTANTNGLPTGQYQASLNLSTGDSSGATLSVPVTLSFSNPTTMSLSTTSLSFAASTGGPAPAHQTVTPTTDIPGQAYTVAVAAGGNAAWLKAAGGGATPAPIDVAVDQTGLVAGTYTGTVTINVPGATNTPQTVNVTLTVTNGPTLTSPSATSGLNFNYEIGFGTSPTQTVALSSVLGDAAAFGIGTIQNSTSNNINWLLVGTPSSVVTPATFSVGVNPQGMAAGTYTGAVVATTAAGSTLSIPVTLTIANLGSPLAGVSPPSLTFTLAPGTISNPQTVTVTSTGEALAYSVGATVNTPTGGTWLTVSNPLAPAFAGVPSTFSVSVQSTGLPVGTYTGSVTVQPTNGNPAQSIPVTLNIATTNLNVSVGTLNFAETFAGPAPPLQTIGLTNTGPAVPYTASVSGGNWLSVFPSSGITPATLAVTVNPGLLPGNYSAQILINGTGVANGQQVVTVNLTVTAQ